ncbi:hypothetical protein Tco_1245258 [Tanacetum coccineum]
MFGLRCIPKQWRIDAIDGDEEITMVSVQNVDEEMFDVNVLDGEEVFAKIDVDHQLAERLQAQEQEELEDLEDLYKLVKAKYESTRPVEDLDLLLWGDLKTMFEPHVEDKDATYSDLYVGREEVSLAPLILSMMLEKKLIINYESEMAYQLLRFIMKQLKE